MMDSLNNDIVFRIRIPCASYADISTFEEILHSPFLVTKLNGRGRILFLQKFPFSLIVLGFLSFVD